MKSIVKRLLKFLQIDASHNRCIIQTVFCYSFSRDVHFWHIKQEFEQNSSLHFEDSDLDSFCPLLPIRHACMLLLILTRDFTCKLHSKNIIIIFETYVNILTQTASFLTSTHFLIFFQLEKNIKPWVKHDYEFIYPFTLLTSICSIY